jgi:hypothetical protein
MRWSWYDWQYPRAYRVPSKSEANRGTSGVQRGRRSVLRWVWREEENHLAIDGGDENFPEPVWPWFGARI